MERAKQVFAVIGLALVSVLVYALVTTIISVIINGGSHNDTDVAFGGWFAGGFLFMVETLFFMNVLGLI